MEELRATKAANEMSAQMHMQERRDHAARMQTAADTAMKLRCELEKERAEHDDLARMWHLTMEENVDLRSRVTELEEKQVALSQSVQDFTQQNNLLVELVNSLSSQLRDQK